MLVAHRTVGAEYRSGSGTSAATPRCRGHGKQTAPATVITGRSPTAHLVHIWSADGGSEPRTVRNLKSHWQRQQIRVGVIQVNDDRSARTRLGQLVKQKRLSTTEFVRLFNHTATVLRAESPTDEKKLTVTWATARRWINGETGLPYPASCRVLERMFEGETAEVLFGPPTVEPEPPAVRASWVATPNPMRFRADEPASADEIEGLTSMAAAESAAFSERAEQSNIGPHTLEQFHDDLKRIVTVYPNRPVYPLLVELRSLASRAFALLEGRQPPARSRELHLIAGMLCAVEANACFDLGNIHAATALARTAFMCGEMAEHDGLCAWVRGLQVLIAFWDNEYEVAADLAQRAWHEFTPECGTARVRLAAAEARARGRLRDERGTLDALRRAEWSREQVTCDDFPGGMMAFPLEKQLFYAASAYLWLGGDSNYTTAERLAEESLDLYMAAVPERRRLGEISLARLDLVSVRLNRRDLDGADEQLKGVLRINGERRTESVDRRLLQLTPQLERPYFQTSALASNMRDNIIDVTTLNNRLSLGTRSAT